MGFHGYGVPLIADNRLIAVKRNSILCCPQKPPRQSLDHGFQWVCVMRTRLPNKHTIVLNVNCSLQEWHEYIYRHFLALFSFLH